MVVVLTIGVLALTYLVYTSTNNAVATITTAVTLVVILLAAWALTAAGDRRRRGRVSPLDEARRSLDVPRVRKARAEHGESAGITEIRRQVPSLTYEQAVELHRYV